MSAKAIERWHEMVESRNAEGLDALLAEDAVFYSPVVHTPQAGREVTKKYLLAAFAALFNDSFRYVREIVGERDAMLEFEMEIDGIYVNGIDIIGWNENDQIAEFKVLVRPLKGIDAVRQQMMKGLKPS